MVNPIGKLLCVDLSAGLCTSEAIPHAIIQEFLGGLGLASKILYEETNPRIDPFSDENRVIISSGLLNGTGAPTAYRAEISAKSPLTEIFGTGNFGGLFGTQLRKAGFEAIVLKGKSSHPVYLKIENERVELKDARHLWGRDTWETTDEIRKEDGEDFSVMAIGPAGENLVRFACPIVDYYHAPGRSHSGCVMGSKFVKAVVVRGIGNLEIAWPEMFEETKHEIENRIRSFPEKGMRHKVGSTYIIAESAKKGRLGGKHYQTGVLPESNEFWRPEDFETYLRKGPTFCGDCSLCGTYGCNVTIDVKEGPFQGLYLEGAGYSHPIWNWGSKCAIESFPAMLKCKELCNRYGMDQNGSVPFALELFQRGIITKDDNDGMELKWGDSRAIFDLLEKIAYRRGLGDILAEGTTRAASIIGGESKKCVLALKGSELFPGGDPRATGMAVNLGHLTNLRGGDDLKTTHTVVEGMPGWAIRQGMKEEQYLSWLLERLDMTARVKETIYGTPPSLHPLYARKESIAQMTKWYEDMTAVRDALGICLFAVNYTSTIGHSLSSRLLSAYLGTPLSPEGLMKAGERIVNLMKSYNVREGMTRTDDDFPSRFYDEPLKDGTTEGPVLSPQELSRLLDTYYALRGWSVKTGYPTKQKLEVLGLRTIAEELSKKGTIE